MSSSATAARLGLVIALACAPAAVFAKSPFGGLFHAKAPTAATSAAPATEYATSWDEYQAMKATAQGGQKKSFAQLPNWTGLWSHDNGFNFDPKQVGPIATAELTPEYKARYLKKLDNVAKGIEWDPLSSCFPAGYPRWLLEPFLREFIVRPEQVWLVNEAEDEVRRVYTDGRGHMPEDEAFPLWEGDSIGFWDGDTLVIHTNHIRAGQYQRLQPDYSDQASTVERLRMIGPNTMEDIVTVYDPPALVKPWHVRHTYSRETNPDLRINQWVCEENNNVVPTASGSSTFILPGEPGYRDPAKLGPTDAGPPAGQPQNGKQ